MHRSMPDGRSSTSCRISIAAACASSSARASCRRRCACPPNQSGTPREILDQVLRPHGLYARPGAQGVLIVARAPRRRDDAAPARVEGPPASDQPAPTASVSGQVRDESGAPIPGAVITVTAAARGAISRTTAGADGRFEIGGLARGRYAVMGEQPGLLPAVIPELLLAAGGRAR